jgi:predicted RNA-binding protein with PUA-like domain
MNHWLLKTEPDCYSWKEMEKDGETFWDGIHNYQARNNLRAMKKGDLAFFYHTGGERRIFGIVEIVKEAYPDQTDPVWSWVDVRRVQELKRPVSLDELKEHPALAGMNLFRQGRLSVVAITEKEWEMILALK